MINRYTKAFSILLVILFASHFEAVGQEQKVGYVDTDFILSQIPEYQGIQQQLELLSKEWRNRLDEMQQEIDRLKEDFSAKEILYTEELRKQKEQEIRNRVQERENYLNSKFGPEGEYYQKQKELLKPIQRKVFEAINTVAQRDGFDFVFDRAEKADLLFADKKWNLNNRVLLEMGISTEGNNN